MKKYIFFLLFAPWVCSFYSCSEDPVLTPPGGGDFTPTLTPPSSVIDGSTITISWGGNEFALQFSYRYKLAADAWPPEPEDLNYEEDGDGGTWSAWSPATEIILCLF